MLKLNSIVRQEGSTKARKRLGAGVGSGTGKTCARGQKGAGARSGAKKRRGFEGGQMPIYRRLPKRGFTSLNTKNYLLISLDQLQALAGENGKVSRDELQDILPLRSSECGYKLLGNGAISQAIEVQIDAASQSAIKAVEAAGGKVTTL